MSGTKNISGYGYIVHMIAFIKFICKMLKVSLVIVLNMSARILKVPSILWIIHLKYKELKGQSIYIKYQEVLNVMNLHMSSYMFLIPKIFEFP